MASLLTQIKVRKDTYENIKDLVLAQGEPGFAHDTGDYAVGDGTKKFSDICFKLHEGVINSGTSTDKAIARFDGTTGRIIQDSTATISDDGHLYINTVSDTTMTTPAIKVLHTGPVNGSSYADLMELAGYNSAPYGFKFRTYGDGTAIIQSQRIRGGSEKFSLSLNPDGGDVLIGGKVIQGTKNTDSTIASMNQFTSDLYVKGDGSAPNSPRVAGFYLGKSAGTDENRHMDIVTGSTVSYIDFNRAGTVRDYDVRLRVNNSTGDVHFQWDSGYTEAQKLLKADGATFEAAVIKKTDGADTHVLLAGGGTKAIDDFQPAGDYLTEESDTLQTVTNRGATTTKGITVDTLSIGNTTATGHINFARGGWNYIKAPSTNSIIGFIAGKSDALAANATLAIDSTSIFPGWTDGTKDIGASSYQWNNIYMKGSIIKGSYTLTLPNKTGTIALTSDIPSLDEYVKGPGSATDNAIAVFDGVTGKIIKDTGIAKITSTNGLEITNNGNTVTIGSKNSSFCHIYNSKSIPFIFNQGIQVTDNKDLGSSSYDWKDLYMSGSIKKVKSTTDATTYTLTLPNKTGTVALLSDLTGGTITSVVAGNGLTGGGTSGEVTLNVGAGTGISVTADAVALATYGTAGTYGPTANATLTHKGTFTVPKVVTDDYGRVTAANIVYTLPEDKDTFNTAGSTNDEAKLYLIGAKSQTTSAQTYSDTEVYTEGGELNATSVCIAEIAQMKYDTTNECLRFVFA